MTVPIRALTIKQPWASLIIRGGKDIENRDWKSDYRGMVAIHSSARMDRADMDDACSMMRGFIPKFSAARFKQDEFPTGAILGTVVMTDCVTSSDSPWFVGEYGFVLKAPVPFRSPIPCKGMLGLWKLSGELLERCREEYRKVQTDREFMELEKANWALKYCHK